MAREIPWDAMHIQLDPSVTPVHAPTRRVPVANLDRVNEQLKRFSEEGIIRPVTQTTDWLSNMLVKEKPNGKLRIRIDPSQTINKVIKRPKYTIPTIEEKLPLLTKAKVFKYQFTVRYKKGKELFIADTLSRSAISVHDDTTPTVMQECKVFRVELAQVDLGANRVTVETMN